MKILTAGALAAAFAMAAAPAFAQYERHDDRGQQHQGYTDRDGDHHEWDRSTFDREYGTRGARWDHQWRRGERLPDGYASDQRYIVQDFRQHRLSRPARGYHWVRYGSGYVQVRDNGYVRSTIYGWRY